MGADEVRSRLLLSVEREAVREEWFSLYELLSDPESELSSMEGFELYEDRQALARQYAALRGWQVK